MATMSLDSILNFIIPIAVTIFIMWILYVPFKEPIDKLFNTIKGWKEGREEEEVELNVTKYINYE